MQKSTSKIFLFKKDLVHLPYMKLKDILSEEQIKSMEQASTVNEASMTGEDFARDLINQLRRKVYPKLSDDELDRFKIEMADHLGLELPSYLKGLK